MSKHLMGITLLELILVLAIGASFFVLSLRFYSSYQKQNQIQQLQYTVNQLLNAMAQYYQANCANTLNPAVSPGITSEPSITVLNGDGGLLTTVFSQPIGNNPLVDYTDSSTYSGFIAQFNAVSANRTPSYTLNQATYTNANTFSTRALSATGGGQTGTNYFWMAQVAVKITNPQTLNAVATELGATCTSTFSNGIVLPCSTTPPSNPQYAVWEQLPSRGLNNQVDPQSSFLPNLIQFNRQYINDEFYGLQTGGKNAGASGLVTNYYICGG